MDSEDLRELFFDATERPTRRPEEGQREFYSGKKRRTIKTQLVAVRRTMPPGPGPKPREVRIAAVCPLVPGKMHDKKLSDRSRVMAPADAKRTGDTGYIGRALMTPTRKPRDGALTDGQKQEDRRISRRRLVAEHGIGKMKVWRVAPDRYRNPVGRHTLIMRNVAGLHDLKYA